MAFDVAKLPAPYEWSLVELDLDVPVQRAFDVIFNQSEFFRTFVGKGGLSEIVIGSWVDDQREYSWTTAGNLLMSPAHVRGKQTIALKESNGFVVQNRGQALDAPYGKDVETHQCARLYATSSNACHISISAEARLLRSFFMSGMVTRTLKGAIEKHFTLYAETLLPFLK